MNALRIAVGCLVLMAACGVGPAGEDDAPQRDRAELLKDPSPTEKPKTPYDRCMDGCKAITDVLARTHCERKCLIDVIR